MCCWCDVGVMLVKGSTFAKHCEISFGGVFLAYYPRYYLHLRVLSAFYSCLLEK